VIVARRLQSSFADGFLREEVCDLWEPWMRHADEILEDETLLELIYEALGRRAPKSKIRGRRGTPAEQVLRLLVLKHARDWSYAVIVREVRANLVYREFTRVGGGKVPDDKTLGRVARQLGPTVIEQIHQRLVTIAQQNQVVSGRKLRVDTTSVETNIHYPTDSSLLKDGVRVLSRVINQVTQVAEDLKTQVRDRTRSVKKRVMEIDRAARNKTEKGQEKLKERYKKLLETVRRVVGQAKQVAAEIVPGVQQATTVVTQKVLQQAKQELDTMIPRVQQVMRQTRQRLFAGNTHAEEKLVSVFEPQTEIIRKGKASKPTEFGKLVKIQEAENQIITHYEVFDQRPSDSALLVPAIEKHQSQLGRVPRVVAADPGFFSAKNETNATVLGVQQVAVPQVGTKNQQRQRRQKKRWFKKAQKWRAGGEGRISVLKRRHGLNRCLYKGSAGMKRWVGLGIIADTLINIGVHLAARGS
jgi:transposase, IS5 family